jgi:hypothetical protein
MKKLNAETWDLKERVAGSELREMEEMLKLERKGGELRVASYEFAGESGKNGNPAFNA